MPNKSFMFNGQPYCISNKSPSNVSKLYVTFMAFAISWSSTAVALEEVHKQLSWIDQIWNLIGILDRSKFNKMWIELQNISNQIASWFWYEYLNDVAFVSYFECFIFFIYKIQTGIGSSYMCLRQMPLPSPVSSSSSTSMWSRPSSLTFCFFCHKSLAACCIVMIINRDDHFQSNCLEGDQLFGFFATRHWVPAIELYGWGCQSSTPSPMPIVQNTNTNTKFEMQNTNTNTPDAGSRQKSKLLWVSNEPSPMPIRQNTKLYNIQNKTKHIVDKQ